jgi:hypothetical protein
MTPAPGRDNAELVRKRLDTLRVRTVRAYAAIAQWSPNDRPLKVVKAHLDNIDAYLTEVEGEIDQCTKSNRASSTSRKRN